MTTNPDDLAPRLAAALAKGEQTRLFGVSHEAIVQAFLASERDPIEFGEWALTNYGIAVPADVLHAALDPDRPTDRGNVLYGVAKAPTQREA